jgi:fatty acid-binding protein DegV
MENIIDLTVSIEQKVYRLLKQQADLSLKSSTMETKCKDMEQIIHLQKQKIAELENKINVLKISGGLSSGRDSAKAKLAINELVREIDKCIGLLNQ